MDINIYNHIKKVRVCIYINKYVLTHIFIIAVFYCRFFIQSSHNSNMSGIRQMIVLRGQKLAHAVHRQGYAEDPEKRKKQV